MSLDDYKHRRTQRLHARIRAAPTRQQSAGAVVLPESLQPAKQGCTTDLKLADHALNLRLARPIRKLGENLGALARLPPTLFVLDLICHGQPRRLAASWSQEFRLSAASSLIYPDSVSYLRHG
ncbi:hypothetical protein [Mesorhizobium sp. NBSH29]|uniref:hypothetical protein n=1 Tax=Mesorhizobium sp. NBSH29 TaxID=2654249 RepID=UPI002156204B|nr:hypothetical protein [Mesorhizobium sp. NBSH29]